MTFESGQRSNEFEESDVIVGQNFFPVSSHGIGVPGSSHGLGGVCRDPSFIKVQRSIDVKMDVERRVAFTIWGNKAVFKNHFDGITCRPVRPPGVWKLCAFDSVFVFPP